MVAPRMDDDLRQIRSNAAPLRTRGKPRGDVGNAALFLASDEARWINGVVLPVDSRPGGNLPGYLPDAGPASAFVTATVLAVTEAPSGPPSPRSLSKTRVRSKVRSFPASG